MVNQTNLIDEKNIRLEKLNRIKELGINPYPENYLDRIKTSEAIAIANDINLRDSEDIKKEFKNCIKLAGRLMAFRSHGKLSFGQIQDLDGRMQVAFVKGISKVKDLKENDEIDSYKFIEKILDIGDYIGVEGELFKTHHGEVTLFVKELTFLGKCLNPMPEKFHGITDEEVILRQRYLETLTEKEARDRFILRSNIIKNII